MGDLLPTPTSSYRPAKIASKIGMKWLTWQMLRTVTNKELVAVPKKCVSQTLKKKGCCDPYRKYRRRWVFSLSWNHKALFILMLASVNIRNNFRKKG